jgi:hypothetical protein
LPSVRVRSSFGSPSWVEPNLFVDEADLGEVVVRTTHSVQPLEGGGTRVTYHMEITSPAVGTLGPRLGP